MKQNKDRFVLHFTDTNMAVANIRYVLQILVVLAMLGRHECYRSFQYLIPNGLNVPNPCNSSYTWNGVGHLIRQGSGARNFFGIDFAKHGFAWNTELCQLDSDGDGRTNGEELGDPDCLWTPGATISVTSNITHPGICDPLDSEKCLKNTQSQSIKCDDLEFQCESVSEEGVEKLEVQMPGQNITLEPFEKTNLCMPFEFPTDGDFHLIAALPVIDTRFVLMVLVVGCSGTLTDLNKPFTCFLAQNQGASCAQPMVRVSGASDGLCMGPKIGYPVGTGENAYKFGILKVHYHNPLNEVQTFHDSSGITMFITKNKRMYDAGVLMVGPSYLQIPPGEENYVEKGKCASKCTTARMSGSINITTVHVHMQSLGKAVEVNKIVPGKRVTYLAYLDTYNTYQHEFINLAEEVSLSPGEEIEVTCHYNSMSKNKTTFSGFTKNDDICQAFIMYYPRENFTFEGGCTTSGDIPGCDPYGPLIEGCELTKLLNSSHPEVKARYQKVYDNCRPGVCLKECVDVVKEVFSHKCYSGSMKAVLINKIKNDAEGDDLFAHARFMAYVSSCDKYIAEEKCEEKKKMTSGASTRELCLLKLTIPIVVQVFMLD